MGWSRLIDIADGLLGLSPEQRQRKLRDKIDKLKRERDEILKKGADEKFARTLTRINNELRTLEQKLQNA